MLCSIEFRKQFFFFFRTSRHFWSIDTRSVWSFWLKIVMERVQEEIYETSIGWNCDETALETSGEGDRHGSRVDPFVLLYIVLRRIVNFEFIAGRVRYWWYSWTMDQVVIGSLVMRLGMDYFRVTCCFLASYGLWACASPLPWPARWNACYQDMWYCMESWRWLAEESIKVQKINMWRIEITRVWKLYLKKL